MRVGKTTKDCSICMTGFQNKEVIRKLPCGHIFHSKCIKPWLKKNVQCPNCRFDVKQYLEKQGNTKLSKSCGI